MVEDDEHFRKKLWLMVAKHVEQEKGTKRENNRKGIAFFKETEELLKIEDILPFFPDFALIDDFKVTLFYLSVSLITRLTFVLMEGNTEC